MFRFKQKSVLLYILSFTIPALIIIVALAGLKISPFGKHTLAISDGKALYLNYLGYVGRAIKGQEDVLFSFTKGLGGNMMSSWGWFLTNPFFVLFALFDISNYMVAYTWVSVLNFCLCGLTMYILLKDLYGHHGSNLIFSSAYALNGFLVANVFQMNFFVGIPVLPIMVLGLRKILTNRSPLIYILSLTYSLLTNFYFGFMICTASLLIFLVFYFADRDQIAGRKSVAVKYIVSSALAGAISSVIWLPAILSLRGGRLDQSVVFENLRSYFNENMPALDMFSKLFTGANSTAELSNGLPNIFVGILPVILVILFFMNKKITKPRKTASAILLIVYLISFFLVILNMVMHGGTVTNWFNYRDSFIFCFLLLMIAAEEWQYITEEPEKNLKRSVVILVVMSLIVFSKRFEYIKGGLVLLDFAILAVMYLAYCMHKKNPDKNPKRVFSMVILVLMCINLFLNYSFCTQNIMDWELEESKYQETVVPVSATIEAVKKYDSNFYRMEVSPQLSGNLGNDPMLYGYYGVGHGGSDDRDFVRLALSELGVRRYNMRNSYGKGVPAATDTLLGMKYIISTDDLSEEKGYNRMFGVDKYGLYENPYALPVVFLSDADIEKVEINLEDIFDNLNKTWKAISGNDELVFIEEDDIEFESHNFFDPSKTTAEEAAKIVSVRDAEADKKASGTESASSENRKKKAETATDKAYERAETQDNANGMVADQAKSSDEDTLESEKVEDGSLTEPPEGESYIKYTIQVHQDGPVYSYNRSGMTEDNGSTIPVMIYEGYYHEGDTITKYLTMQGNIVSQNVLEDVAGRFKTAYVNMDALASMSEIVKNRPVETERMADSHLRGSFTAQEKQTIIFTIPYDEGWTLYIDGKKTEYKKVLDVFMAADVEAGTHTYEMRFVPSGLMNGIKAAIIGIVVTILYCLYDRKKRHMRSPRVSKE